MDTVIVVSGEGADPMNDNNVTVGFYVSNDKMVKDGNGNIARDYTFRIAPHAKYEGILPGPHIQWKDRLDRSG